MSLSFRELLPICRKTFTLGNQKRYLHHLRVSQLFPISKATENDYKDHGKGVRIKSLQESQCHSQKLMFLQKLLFRGVPGAFTLLPHTTRALHKLHKVIDQSMKQIGAQKIIMPTLASGKMWKKSGRWEEMGSELFTLKDRGGAELCLAPTHEEEITSLVVGSESPLSHKVLPVKLYQIGRKFRDEPRPKNGLLRGREFEMKDLYIFDKDQNTAMESYDTVCEAYTNIFYKLGLNAIKVEASTGAMGGSQSHEFHLLSEIGEDTLQYCKRCNAGINEELIDENVMDHHRCQLSNCQPEFKRVSGIEVAHAFLLGTKYSETFKAVYTDEYQKKRFLYMGCYGIGVTRLLAAAIEVLSTEDQIRWPTLLAPYQVCIIPQKKGYKADETWDKAVKLCDKMADLKNLSGEFVLDDRLHMSIGRRLYQAKQMGYPYVIAVGKKALDSPPVFEVVDIYNSQSHYLTESQVMDYFSKIKTVDV